MSSNMENGAKKSKSLLNPVWCAKLSLAAEISRRLAGRAGFHESATASPRYGQPGKQTKIQTKLGNNKKTKPGNNKKTKLGNNKNNKKGFHELTTAP